ncbi:hypothetical protein WA158_001532 [Blastocystis sp. Blastoise]
METENKPVEETTQPQPETQPIEGEPKLSKSQLKKLAKKKDKPKVSKEEKMKAWGLSGNKAEKKEKVPKEEKKDVPVIPVTPKGEKKDLSSPLADSYYPAAVESAWADWWEAQGFFKPNVERALNLPADKKFIMVIPPPNVTGTLHLGHALTNAIEDTITRWKRMSGYETVWVPGIDHAGIATQVVVEKNLMKEEGKSRHDLGREAFVEKVWEWKNQYGNKITTQLRKLGVSVDWSRQAFTMDDNLSRAVKEAFVQLYDKGLIYRSNRLVNWCCTLKTAISDIEVEYIDLEGATKRRVPGHGDHMYEFGTLTEFAYPVENSDEKIIVATTRLETMLGDTAVAVHPEDPRYTHLHGKYVIHPINGRRIPIITDSILVDMNFGTGAVKITPAHDPNDFECGKRHNLEFINVFNDNGSINSNGGEYEGMMRFDARVAIEKKLKELGLFIGKKNNKMQIPICTRSGDVVEPLIKPQWYVKCDGMAEKAMKAVETGDLKILPEIHVATWNRWLSGIHDWCISRQLWWGHRIPAYKVSVEGQVQYQEGNELWVVGRNEEEAMERAIKITGASKEHITLAQDEDVLDTWFSSGLFPFSVFGWPNEENNDELKAFYPTSLLETGHDILFFWVARMVMMGLELTNKLPFNTIYLHAMVRDKYGRKMSKSLGNVIDPLDVIYGISLDEMIKKISTGNLDPREVKTASDAKRKDFPQGIPECGTDALRFGLLAYTLQGRDINLDIQRVVGYRMFGNKLWNAVKFGLMNIEGYIPTLDDINNLDVSTLPLRDQWILSRLSYCAKMMNESLASYEFANASTYIYNFWLYDFCDKYLEMTKDYLYSKTVEEQQKNKTKLVLYLCLENGLRLLHPIMPFITEELWQRLPGRGTLNDPATIMLASYPQEVPAWNNSVLEEKYNVLDTLVHEVRSLRADYNLLRKDRPPFYLATSDKDVLATLQDISEDFSCLALAGSVECVYEDGEQKKEYPHSCALKTINNKLAVYVNLKGYIDFENEKKRLNDKKTALQTQIEDVQKKMNVEDYETKVPEGIRNRNTEKFNNLTEEMTKLDEAIKKYEEMSA